jgi:hypothetical protein
MANQEKKDYKTQIKTFLSDWAKVAKKKWWIYLVELAVVAIILVADLLSKQAAWEYLENYGVKELIPNLFNLVMVKNMGAGFGIFQGKTVALTVVTFIVVICICVYLFFALKESEWLRISLVFVTAGGIGNIGLRQAGLAAEISGKKLELEKSSRRPKIAAVAELHFDGPITIEVPVINKN